MIDNQVQQIDTLTSQLTEFKNYEAVFGNPSKVVLSMVAPLDADLQNLEPDMNLENLVANANGNFALNYNDSGIYATVGASFQTPGGQTIQRPANQYKPFAAINRYREQLCRGCRQRGATARDHQGSKSPRRPSNFRTPRPMPRFKSCMAFSPSLNGDLASTDDEVNQAASSAMVQDIQNRNDQQKQIQALTEQQNAEFAESVSNYTAKFQLLNAPTTFPTP